MKMTMVDGTMPVVRYDPNAHLPKNDEALYVEPAPGGWCRLFSCFSNIVICTFWVQDLKIKANRLPVRLNECLNVSKTDYRTFNCIFDVDRAQLF